MRPLHAAPIGLLLLLLAACGGSAGGATTEPAGVPTDAPAVTASAAEPAPSTAGGGGTTGQGWATKPCELLAQADVEHAAGVTGLVPTPLTMDASSGLCGYKASDNTAEVVLTIWGGQQASGMFNAIAYLADNQAEGIRRVDGVGADAIFSETDGTLVLIRNGTAVQVAVRLPDRQPAEVEPIAKELARQVAARL